MTGGEAIAPKGGALGDESGEHVTSILLIRAICWDLLRQQLSHDVRASKRRRRSLPRTGSPEQPKGLSAEARKAKSIRADVGAELSANLGHERGHKNRIRVTT